MTQFPADIPPMQPRFQPAGDSAVLVTFGTRIDAALNRQVHALARRLGDSTLEGVGEAVPGYASLLVHFDLLRLDYDAVVGWIRQNLADDAGLKLNPRRVEVPVVYGGEDGPDLAFVAEHNHLTIEEVLTIHSGRDYPVYLMGFMPGFPYLGGLDPAIAAPRLATPRSRVPAGSVGIAGAQTGIYPLESPGGWRIIGRTPLKLFDLTREPPFLLAPGDLVRFVPLANGEDSGA
jgi:KipI family sensor histidine kinase inhibitor